MMFVFNFEKKTFVSESSDHECTEDPENLRISIQSYFCSPVLAVIPKDVTVGNAINMWRHVVPRCFVIAHLVCPLYCLFIAQRLFINR